MYIHFTYHGSTYNADLAKQDNDKILVSIKDNGLKKQFGGSLSFFVKDKSAKFYTANRSHSDLFALNSSISRAINEQCRDILLGNQA